MTSARCGSASISYFKLDLDIQRWAAEFVYVCGGGPGRGGVAVGVEGRSGCGDSPSSPWTLPAACRRNQPNVHEQKLLDNGEGWHGAELSVVIAGNWQYYRAKVFKYLQQIAVITPYAQVRRPQPSVQPSCWCQDVPCLRSISDAC